MRASVAAARHGGIPLQENGKWLIFGKDSRGACVIPGPSEARSPESISPVLQNSRRVLFCEDSDYGFRARPTGRPGMTALGYRIAFVHCTRKLDGPSGRPPPLAFPR